VEQLEHERRSNLDVRDQRSGLDTRRDQLLQPAVGAELDYRPPVWAALSHAAKDVALDTVAKSQVAGRAVAAESVLRDVLVAANLMGASNPLP
jgi:hypothetical protein